MDQDDESKPVEGWEVTPARMVIPVAPLPSKDEIANGNAPAKNDAETTALVQGLATLPASVDDAKRRADYLRGECRRYLAEGDVPGFVKLLDQNPHFIEDPWVRERLVELAKQKRLTRRRGRPAGRYETHPLVVVGCVEQLIASDAAKNREQAFGFLEQCGAISYEAAKDLFYRALRDERFRAVLPRSLSSHAGRQRTRWGHCVASRCLSQANPLHERLTVAQPDQSKSPSRESRRSSRARSGRGLFC
jgi:hypothetical protein